MHGRRDPSRLQKVINGISSSCSFHLLRSDGLKSCTRLTAAGADFGLHILTKSSITSENTFPFGGGLSGHHGKINDMVFCGGWDEDTARYVATVSGINFIFSSSNLLRRQPVDDKMLMVWDLYPSIDMPSPFHSQSPSPDYALTPAPDSRPPPTAYVIPFPHPLSSIRAHPGTSKEFLVSDCHGSVFLTDWRTGPDDNDDGSLRHSSVIELVEPLAMAAASMGTIKQGSVSIDWRRDAMDMYAPFLGYPFATHYFNSVGGVYGNKFALWDISKLRGGLPTVSGSTFPEGGSVFRYVFRQYFTQVHKDLGL